DERDTGGGAIRGIGEKFATNPVTGTGSLTASPSRSGFVLSFRCPTILALAMALSGSGGNCPYHQLREWPARACRNFATPKRPMSSFYPVPKIYFLYLSNTTLDVTIDLRIPPQVTPFTLCTVVGRESRRRNRDNYKCPS